MIIFDVKKFKGDFTALLRQLHLLNVVANGVSYADKKKQLRAYYAHAIEGIQAILKAPHEFQSLFYKVFNRERVTIKTQKALCEQSGSSSHNFSYEDFETFDIEKFRYDSEKGQYVAGLSKEFFNLTSRHGHALQHRLNILFKKYNMSEEEKKALIASLNIILRLLDSGSPAYTKYSALKQRLESDMLTDLELAVDYKAYLSLQQAEVLCNERLCAIQQAEALAALIDRLRVMEHRIGESVFDQQTFLGATVKKATDNMMPFFGNGGYVQVKHYTEIFKDFKALLAEFRTGFHNADNTDAIEVLNWLEVEIGKYDETKPESLFELEARVSNFIKTFCEVNSGYKFGSDTTENAPLLKTYDKIFVAIVVFFELNLCSVSREVMHKVPGLDVPCVDKTSDPEILTNSFKEEFRRQVHTETAGAGEASSSVAGALVPVADAEPEPSASVVDDMLDRLRACNPAGAEEFFGSLDHILLKNTRPKDQGQIESAASFRGGFWDMPAIQDSPGQQAIQGSPGSEEVSAAAQNVPGNGQH